VVDVVIPIRADDRTARAFAKVESRLSGIEKKVHGAGSAMRSATGDASGLGNRLKTIATGFAGFAAARGITQTLFGFEESMAKIRAATRASSVAMQQMTARARELGATTRFSATQAADGMLFLAKAGFETNEVIASIGATLNLATAQSMDLAQASDIVASTLRQFHLEAGEANRVADTFVASANAAKVTVSELAQAMTLGGIVAKQMGVSLEDTTAALGVLADSGLKATRGGTALRAVLLGLVAPNKKLDKVLDQVGLKFADVDIEARGLLPVMKTLGEASLSTEQAVNIFGDRFAAAGRILAQGVPKFNEIIAKQKELQSAAADSAAIMANTLVGATFSLTSAISEAILKLGDSGLGGALRSLIDKGTEAVRIMAGTSGSMDRASVAGKFLATTIKAAGSAIGVLVTGGLLNWLGRTAIALKAFALANPVTAFIALGAAVFSVVSSLVGMSAEAQAAEKKLRDLDSQIRSIEGNIDSLGRIDERIARAREVGNLNDELAGVLAKLRSMKEASVDLRQILTKDLADAFDPALLKQLEGVIEKLKLDVQLPDFRPLQFSEKSAKELADQLARVQINIEKLKTAPIKELEQGIGALSKLHGGLSGERLRESLLKGLESRMQQLTALSQQMGTDAVAPVKDVIKAVEQGIKDLEARAVSLREKMKAAAGTTSPISSTGGGASDRSVDQLLAIQKALREITPSSVRNLDKVHQTLERFGALGNVSGETTKLALKLKEAQDKLAPASKKATDAQKTLTAAQTAAKSEMKRLGEVTKETEAAVKAAEGELRKAKSEVDALTKVITDGSLKTGLYTGVVDALVKKMQELKRAIREAAAAQRDLNSSQGSGGGGGGGSNDNNRFEEERRRFRRQADDLRAGLGGSNLGSGPNELGGTTTGGRIPAVIAPPLLTSGSGNLSGPSSRGSIVIENLQVIASDEQGGSIAADAFMRELAIRARDAGFAMEGSP
jgi:TP901 family phage tail tape measure protein